MNIHAVKYIEKGYFLVDYGSTEVFQDLDAIKLTVSSDESIKKTSIVEAINFYKSLIINHK